MLKKTVLAMLLMTACGPLPEVIEGQSVIEDQNDQSDAGYVDNASVSPDASIETDAGATPDSAVETDATIEADAASEPDAYIETDAAIEADASIETDAGATPDSAVETDATIEADAASEPDTYVEPSEDLDGDGYTVEDGDCDDTRSDIHPGAEEICDGADQDCNGLADVSTNDGIYVDTRTTYFMDSDGDGHGRADVYYVGCQPPNFPYVVGTVDMQFDCDDTRSDIHPGAAEICGDSRDNDCDGDVDENVIAIYLDFDGDGYGSNQIGTLRCPGNDLPVHFVDNSLDCDDDDASNYPGATEICGDHIDQDCDGSDLACSTPPEPRTRLTIWLAPGSPSGSGFPQWGEILRFNVTVDTRGEAEIFEIDLQIDSTDNAESAWNACNALDDSLKWGIYDTSDYATPLADPGDWSFNDSNGTCLDGGLQTVKLNFKADPASGGDYISAGATKTYSLKMDMTGASTSQDDVVRAKITGIKWSDGHYDFTQVNGLPLVGGTIIF